MYGLISISLPCTRDGQVPGSTNLPATPTKLKPPLGFNTSETYMPGHRFPVCHGLTITQSMGLLNPCSRRTQFQYIRTSFKVLRLKKKRTTCPGFHRVQLVERTQYQVCLHYLGQEDTYTLMETNNIAQNVPEVSCQYGA